MSKFKINNDGIVRLIILFEKNQPMQLEITRILAEKVSNSAEIDAFDLVTGNAYNTPKYLVKAIRNHENSTMVIAWDWNNGEPHPRALAKTREICSLIDALKSNPKGDSWKIAVDVNKKIRAAECEDNE